MERFFDRMDYQHRLYQRSNTVHYELRMCKPGEERQGYTAVNLQLLLFMRWLCENDIYMTPQLVNVCKQAISKVEEEEEEEEGNGEV